MSSSQTSSSSSESQAPPLAARPFGTMHDVICPVDVVLGNGAITVGACLRLARQSVIRLSQSAGSDPTVVINNVTLARGQVVIVEDATAIRITEITNAPGVR